MLLDRAKPEGQQEIAVYGATCLKLKSDNCGYRGLHNRIISNHEYNLWALCVDVDRDKLKEREGGGSQDYNRLSFLFVSVRFRWTRSSVSEPREMPGIVIYQLSLRHRRNNRSKRIQSPIKSPKRNRYPKITLSTLDTTDSSPCRFLSLAFLSS